MYKIVSVPGLPRYTILIANINLCSRAGVDAFAQFAHGVAGTGKTWNRGYTKVNSHMHRLSNGKFKRNIQ